MFCAVLLVTAGGPASAGKASSSSKCEKSLTTASGSRAPSGLVSNEEIRVCFTNLIF